MDAILQIDDKIFKMAQLEATRDGKSVRQWVEEALSEQLTDRNGFSGDDVAERRRQFDALLANSGGFRIGSRPGRDEMNER